MMNVSQIRSAVQNNISNRVVPRQTVSITVATKKNGCSFMHIRHVIRKLANIPLHVAQ